MHTHSNHLIHETSPYLLQHAHNPVEWYPWSDTALDRARNENKPILVSIGYSACHWCHVMERESFEDETTAKLMNEHFINIKIDREERPDLDHIFMDAVQAMTGSGGWPLNVFLTPEGKPFYGGTYFPPKKAFNRPSWQEILMGVADAFSQRRHEIDAQAQNLTEHLLQSNSFGLQAARSGELLQKGRPDEMVTNIMNQADKQWGGFGNAPKFPQTFTIQFLLRYSYVKGRAGNNESKKNEEVSNLSQSALNQALLSLDKMIQGGLYDQAGGGFARYSTDAEWLAPHFEKMLYDNALLVSVIAEAYQLTGRERYRQAISETMEFIRRELLDASNGFYAALDADSEGEEGKFYVWTRQEIETLLGEDADVFSQYYGITEAGNWEGRNILWIKEPLEKFAIEKGIDIKDLEELLERGRKKLMIARNSRVRPGLDDKIILGWNALMNTATSKAFAATGNEAYRQLAVQNMRFLLENLKSAKEPGFHHTWKNGEAKYPAFLDDYAYLIQALLHLQEITGDPEWLLRAETLTKHVIEQFIEKDSGFFYYTGKDQADIILRKKELYDGAIPSGNAIMAQNLYQLAILLDRPEWMEHCRGMVGAIGNTVVKYPTSFGAWACLLQEMIVGTNEIVVMGKDPDVQQMELLKQYIPHRVLMVSKDASNWPLLSGKSLAEKTNIWLCRNYSCHPPVYSVPELISLINREEALN